MSFGDEMRAFQAKIEKQQHDIFIGVGEECHRSIQEGSVITGAPGQPVGQYEPPKKGGIPHVGGVLRGSWQRWFPSASSQRIATDAPYAAQEEDGVSYAHGGSPITQRSTIGGFHSVKLTVAGFQRIVEIVTARVVGRK